MVVAQVAEQMDSTGRSGYLDAFNEFKMRWQQGEPMIDIMLTLRERFDEDLIDTVLADARQQGFI